MQYSAKHHRDSVPASYDFKNPLFDPTAAPVALPSPFDTPEEEEDVVSASATEGSYTYALVKSGPAVPSDECEVDAAAIEVRVTWDETVLHVAHLNPVRSFYIGEEERKNIRCDFLVPAEKLGATRAPLVIAEPNGAARLVLLPGAVGTIHAPHTAPVELADLVAQGVAQPSAEHNGAFEIALPIGSSAMVELAGLRFSISSVRAGKKIAGHLSVDRRTAGYAGLSAAVHAGLLAAMAVFLPPLGATASDEIDDQTKYVLMQALAAASERDLPESKDPILDKVTDGSSGGTGARAKSEEGKMGSEVSTEENRKWANKGPKDNPDPRIARARALEDAQNFGMIGILASMQGDVDAPTAPWGADDSSGTDPISALGNMWGAELGEAAGAGGLGLSGIGEGGGGRFEGVGMGAIGTFGHGSGLGLNDGFGNGVGSGYLPSGHKPKAHGMRQGETTASGRLPPEVIQRVVRQNFGRFRLCYQNALRNNPNLAGRVAVSFVIGRDGAVSMAQNGGSDLPDAGVVSCVVGAFYNLSFPQPEQGIVTVTYPIMFSPEG
jgi:hypothetical protein